MQAARKSAPTTGGVKKPHRYRPGTVALRLVSNSWDGYLHVVFDMLLLICFATIVLIKQWDSQVPEEYWAFDQEAALPEAC